MFKDLREFLDFLDRQKDLITIKNCEISDVPAAVRKVSDTQGPAILFKDIKGYDIPVAGGIFATRDRAFSSLKTSEGQHLEKISEAVRDPIPPKLVESGSCQEFDLTGNKVDFTKIPIPTHSEKDAGPYITAGLQITKDPETGTRNAAIYRMQVKGKNRLSIEFQPFADIATQLAKAEKTNKPLEIAIAVGLDPVIYIASQIKVPYGVDILGIAGKLRGEAVEVVKCKTVDLEVPANSEFVIEGKVLPNTREPEGPFGDFTGYYGDMSPQPVIEAKAITHRENPIYQTMLSGMPRTENHVLVEIGLEATMYDELKRTFPDMKATHVICPGQSIGIVSLKQRYKGQARRLILEALGRISRLKYLITVDEDIDVFNTDQVLWAIATRAQPAEDFIIVSNVSGGPLDPSVPEKGITSIMGIDATKPFGVQFPGAVKVPKSSMKLTSA